MCVEHMGAWRAFNPLGFGVQALRVPYPHQTPRVGQRAGQLPSGGSSRSSLSCYHTQCCSTLCWRLLFPGTVGSRACPPLESDGSVPVLCSSSSAPRVAVFSCVGCATPNCCRDPGCERCLLLPTLLEACPLFRAPMKNVCKYCLLQRCHCSCDNRAVCSRQNESSLRLGCNTVVGVLLTPSPSVAKGLLHSFFMPVWVLVLLCDRFCVGTDSIEAPLFAGEVWNSRYCANQDQQQRGGWTPLLV